MLKLFLGSAFIQFIGKIILIVTGVIIARNSELELYGNYSYLLSIVSLLAIPVIAGLPQLLVREVSQLSKVNDLSKLKGIVSWSGIYTLIVYVLVSFCYLVFIYTTSSEISYLNLIILLIVFFKVTTLRYSAIINGTKKTLESQLAQAIVYSLILFGCTLYLVFVQEIFDSMDLLIINLISYIFAATFSFVLFKTMKISVALKSSSVEMDVTSWQKSLLPFTLMFVLVNFNAELGVLFLGMFSTSENVAIFKVSSQGIVIIMLAMNTINTVISPDLSSLYKENRLQEMQTTLSESVKITTCFMIPIVILFFAFGEQVIVFLFGQKYVDAYPVLLLLTVGQIFNTMLGSPGVLLNMAGFENFTLKIMVLSVVIYLSLLFLFVSPFGVQGAAISLVITNIFWKANLALFSYRKLGLVTWFKPKLLLKNI
ncbi:oligosaccharide flippase family protein [Vibrio echinoideorum]|uniref:oligosaccharide flippase family protein n=1 Tax=Vibrio echinoideorum TaxID=2100116 RepID=UPI001080D44E|nr:oligosaccharide flippase family protein [Vibrio echinoideorum]